MYSHEPQQTGNRREQSVSASVRGPGRGKKNSVAIKKRRKFGKLEETSGGIGRFRTGNVGLDVGDSDQLVSSSRNPQLFPETVSNIRAILVRQTVPMNHSITGELMISTLSGRQFTRLVAWRYNVIASLPLQGKQRPVCSLGEEKAGRKRRQAGLPVRCLCF